MEVNHATATRMTIKQVTADRAEVYIGGIFVAVSVKRKDGSWAWTRD